jgi:hypothetical protein
MLWNCRLLSVAVLLVLVCLLSATAGLSADEPPAAPKVSTFAPAEDLAKQVDRYLKELDDCVAAEGDYKDNESKIAQDSNTLIVLALALGLHDQANKYQASAGAIMKAAQAVATTKDYASAKKAVADLQKAAESSDAAKAELKWEKVAALPELMKQVPVVNTKLKMNLKPEKFKKKAKDAAGYSAVLAVIAQGTVADTSAAKGADQVKKWYEFSALARDHAGALNAAIHKGDAKAAEQELTKVAQNCDDCHAIFHPEAK